MNDRTMAAVVHAASLLDAWVDVMPRHEGIPVLERISRTGVATNADVRVVLDAVLYLARLAETPPPMAAGGVSTLQQRSLELIRRLRLLPTNNGGLAPLGLGGLEWVRGHS